LTWTRPALIKALRFAAYAGDVAYSDSQVTATCTGVPDECRPIRSLVGPDGRNYRIDTYITWDVPVNTSGTTGRNTKLVTVVVRSASTPTTVYARVSSAFDESTGL
jgi:hypothetical protein